MKTFAFWSTRLQENCRWILNFGWFWLSSMKVVTVFHNVRSVFLPAMFGRSDSSWHEDFIICCTPSRGTPPHTIQIVISPSPRETGRIPGTGPSRIRFSMFYAVMLFLLSRHLFSLSLHGWSLHCWHEDHFIRCATSRGLCRLISTTKISNSDPF